MTQPVHIMRRIIEVHERQSEPLRALFLGWSKAFDSVTFVAGCPLSPYLLGFALSRLIFDVEAATWNLVMTPFF